MKTKEIKEMNKNERMNHAIMLMNSFKSLMVDDIAAKALGERRNGSEEYWRKEFSNSVRIVENMMKMRNLDWNICYVLRM